MRHRRKLSAQELNRSFPDVQIYLNEHLITENRQIFNKARELVKRKILHAVWTSDTRVMTRQAQDGRHFWIRDQRHIRDIEGQSVTPQAATPTPLPRRPRLLNSHPHPSNKSLLRKTCLYLGLHVIIGYIISHSIF